MITSERVRSRARGVFPGWWIVAAALGILSLQAGLFQQAYGTYVAVLQDRFGWSSTALSLAFAFQSIESGILGPIQGWMIDRFTPRRVLRVGLVVFAIGFFMLSQVDSLVSFYVAFIVTAIGAGLSGFLSLTTVIVHWFERKRSTAMAVSQLGASVGGLMLPLVAWSLTNLGWQQTLIAAGLIVLVFGMPLVNLMRNSPEEAGYLPDGRRPDEALEPVGSNDQAGPAANESEYDFTPREAFRTQGFWFLNAGHAASLLVVSAIQVHLVLHLTNGLGYSLQTAASVNAIFTVAMIPARLVGGVLGDQFDKRWLAALSLLGHSAGIVLLAFAESFLMIMLFALLHGVSWGIRGPAVIALRADFFGRRSFGTIMGMSSMMIMAGQMIGPVFAGLMADRLGDYRMGFTILAVTCAVGSAFFMFARKPSPPRRQRRVAASLG